VLRRIATNAAALAVSGVLAQLVFVSIEIAIARQLGRDTYGVFATAYVIALTTWAFVDLGMSWRLIEAGSRNPRTIAEILGTTMALKVVVLLLIYPLIVGGLGFLGYDARTIGLLLIFFLYALAIAMQDSVAAAYTARQRMVVNAGFQAATPIAVACCVIVAMALGGGLNAVGFAYGIGGLAVTLIWVALVFKDERPRVRLSALGSILRGSYLYGLTGMLSQLFYKSDILLLSAFAPVHQVGIYAAGYKLLDLAYKVPLIGAKVVSPALFQHYETSGTLYARSADAFVRVSAVAGLVPAVICYQNAPLIIDVLYGEGYEAAAMVLRVLSLSFVLKFVGGALQTVLTTRGQHTLRTSGLAFSTAAAAAAHVVMIPAFGAIGAAAVVVAGEGLLLMLYVVGVGDRALRRLLLKRVLAVTFAATAAISLPAALGAGGLGASVLGLVACVAVLGTFGFLPVKEITLIRGAMRARRASR